MPPVSATVQHPRFLPVGVALLLLFPVTAGAVTAPAVPPAVSEIPRPSRAWVPQGFRATPEAERLGALLEMGRAPLLAAPAGGAGAVRRDEASATSAGRARAARAAWAEFAARPGLRAEAAWNARTGLPHRIRAAGLRVPERALITLPAAEAAARGLIAREAALLTGGEAPGPEEMPLVKARRVGQLWFLVFGQRSRGLEVVDGRVDVRLRVDGEVPVVGSDWQAGVGVTPEPLVHRSAAAAVARAAVGFDPARDTEGGADLVVLPVPEGDGVAYRLAHRIRLAVQSPPGRWVTYIDAQDGRVWARENELRYAGVAGTVSGDIQPATYTDAFVRRPLPHLEVWRGSDTAVTDGAGAYSLPGALPGDDLHAALVSPFLAVANAAGPDAALDVLVPPSGPLDLVFSAANSDSAERNAYFQALATHAYAKALDPGLTALDYPMPCQVNLAATCNAYWDGEGINFFNWGGGCANTGNIADVIFHEYGHGVTQFTFAPFGPNGAMHEGFSDYLAATMSRQPLIGRGFRGPGTQLRTTQNSVALPATSCNGEVHCVGNAVSGALWDTQRNLIASLGDSAAAQAKTDSLWHYAGYGGAYWFDDYLLDLLLVDDDDGQLADGTPHYADICAAFEAHGFACPEAASGPWIADQPLPDAELAAGPFAVTAEMGSTSGALDPGGQRLFHRFAGGPWHEVDMAHLGGATYQASIPAPPAAGRIDYYLENRDATSAVATSPAGAPAAVHTFHVGAAVTVYAEDFEQGEHGWTSLVGNTALSGRWQLVDPHGTSDSGFPFQPEDDHTADPGVTCWVTGDTTGSPMPGPGADDVDGGCVTLVSPAIDLSGLDNARLDYWRWFTDETSLDDTLHVDVSADDGATWQPLESQPFTENIWREMSFDLGSRLALTAAFRLRVRVCDLGGGSLCEAALDDVSIVTRPAAPVAIEGGPRPPGALALAPAVPNPLAGGTVIGFAVPGPADGAPRMVALGIFDARGRLVRTLVRASLPPGRYTAPWDARDGAGRRVAAGAYLCRLAVGGEARTGKLVVLP